MKTAIYGQTLIHSDIREVRERPREKDSGGEEFIYISQMVDTIRR